jgi:hypothetical protein
MRYIVLSFLLQISATLSCQSFYELGFDSLKMKLGSTDLLFKDAVFFTEKLFFEDSLNRESFDKEIQLLVELVKIRERNSRLEYAGKDLKSIKTNAAIFKTLIDTTIVLVHDTSLIVFMPYRYDFDDMFGNKDWSNMFVTKLLRTRTGNCHSLPYLYKILGDELGVKAYLSLSPNHTYIKQRAEKGGWYNTELTSASFPIDAWLIASGYISLEAVQNGIYLDTLSENECLSLCVLDLAQGYKHKYPDNDGTFIIDCCDLALTYFPDYVNAILLKAETRLSQLQKTLSAHGFTDIKDANKIPEAKPLLDEMNQLYYQLYKLGYRQMPEQMYLDWISSLINEKEKFNNTLVPTLHDD